MLFNLIKYILGLKKFSKNELQSSYRYIVGICGMLYKCCIYGISSKVSVDEKQSDLVTIQLMHVDNDFQFFIYKTYFSSRNIG